MAVVLETNARNAACDAVVDLLDGGTIEYQTGASAVLATGNLPTPAFGAASGGAAAMSSAVNATVSTGGTVAKAVFKTSGGTAVFTASVAASGGDINFSSVVVATNDVLALSSYTHTQPAS